MRRTIVLVALAVAVASCGGGTALDDTSTTATTGDVETTVTTGADATTTTSTTVAETVPPSGPVFIRRGERGAFVSALQAYLECAGYGPLAVDGVFGDGTAAAVEAAQADQGKSPTGEPDEDTFARLSRECTDPRTIRFRSGATSAEAAGNAAPGDDEEFRVRVLGGQEMTVEADAVVDLTVQAPDGSVLHRPDGSTLVTVEVPATGDHTIWVSAAAPTSFTLTVTVPEPPEETTTTAGEAAGFHLAVDGFGEIDFGEESGPVVTALIDRFGPPASDTGWEDVPDSPFPCGTVTRTVRWEFPAGGGHPATTLDVVFHDFGFSNPAFARWDYRLTNHDDRDQRGSGVLETAHGLSVGDTYVEAVGYGFVLGGFEELSHGQLDGIDVWVYEVTDYQTDGWVGSMGAGTGICDNDV